MISTPAPFYLSTYLPLAQVFDQYQRYTGHELEKAVCHGDTQVPLLSLGRGLLRTCRIEVSPEMEASSLSTFPSLLPASVIRNTPLFFTDKLNQAIQVRATPYGSIWWGAYSWARECFTLLLM